MMRTIGLVAALMFELCQATTTAAAETYAGTRESFQQYKSDHRLDEWSLPDTIDFFSAPDGNPVRYAHWPRSEGVPAAGTVVHFNGRTEFIERNARTYRDLTEKGWDVWTLDWRGQGLSYRSLAGEAAVRGHIDSFATYVTDATHFVDSVVKLQDQGEPHVLLAHSMGGQIALRYLLEHPERFDFVVLSSPLVRLPGAVGTTVAAVKAAVPIFNENCVIDRLDDWQSSFESSACKALEAEDPAIQLRDATATEAYTHDAKGLAAAECLVEQSLTGRYPGLAVACPTDSWLGAAGESINDVFENRDKLTMPMLMVAAQDDPAVDPEGQRELCGQLPACTLVQVPGAGHELLIETDNYRGAFLKCFDAFVADPDAGRAECKQIVEDIRP